MQDVKAQATELAAGSKDGDEEKAIRAEWAHASALEVCRVEPVKCSSTARLNRLNHGFTFFSFLQSLHQAQQRRLAVEDTRKQLRQRFRWATNTPIRWVIVDGPDAEPRLAGGTPEKATKGTPRPKKGEELVFLTPQWEEEGDAAGTTWPVIAFKDSTSFSNRHAAEEALKEHRAQKQEAIDEVGKKTMEDSPSYSPLEEKEVTPAPEAEAEKDSDNGVPVPTPPVIQEPKDTEKHIPVPSPPEVPEPKESEEQVVKEEELESAGPGVQEHQDSGEDSPAAPVGQEEIEEVGGAPKDEEMPACKQEDNEEAAPEVGAPVPHVKEEPLRNHRLFTCLKGMRGWQWREQHGARYRRQFWGAVMVQGHHRVQVAVQTRRDPDLVRRVERTHPKCTPPTNLHCARSGPWGGRSSHACTYASKG